MSRTSPIPSWLVTREGCGWRISAMLHAGGAFVLAALPHEVVEPPRLPGSESAIVLDLRPYSTEQEQEPTDEPPLRVEWTQDSADALRQPQFDIVVMPEHAQIAERRYHVAAVDLVRPSATGAVATPEPAQYRDPPHRAPSPRSSSHVSDVSPPQVAPPSLPVDRPSAAPPAVTPVAVPHPIGVDDKIVPRPLDNRPPHYPDVAIRNGWSGRLVLLLHVTADGAVDEVHVDSSSGHAVLDAAAVRAVKSWRFEPARRGGKPVDCRLRLPVVFQR